MITANTWFECKWEFYVERRIKRRRKRFRIPDTGYDDIAVPIVAHINHGNWLISCPCGGFEYAWEEGFVFCFSCLNSYIGHKVRRTIFPGKRKQIEELLKDRPIDYRNWDLGETLSNLRLENIEHVDELLSATGGEKRWVGQHRHSAPRASLLRPRSIIPTSSTISRTSRGKPAQSQ